MTETKHGFLVLVDISGFTAFVTATALEHGPPIIAEPAGGGDPAHLAPARDPGDRGRCRVRGRSARDGAPPGENLLDVLHAGFLGFRARQRALEADESCSCNACRHVGQLRLKAIGHYGRFLEHTVGGHAQTAGRDVILAHRLLKNAVPRKGDYALLTQPALRYMEVDPGRLGLLPHTERYEHFGDVECFVADLA